jgi:hypothetical protein
MYPLCAVSKVVSLGLRTFFVRHFVRLSTRWRAECGRAALAASGVDMAALEALLSDGGEFGEL